MRWPWSRSSGDNGGHKAHIEAAKSLRETEAMWPEVTRVSKSLRELRERNHFAESVTMIFRGSDSQ